MIALTANFTLMKAHPTLPPNICSLQERQVCAGIQTHIVSLAL